MAASAVTATASTQKERGGENEIAVLKIVVFAFDQRRLGFFGSQLPGSISMQESLIIHGEFEVYPNLARRRKSKRPTSFQFVVLPRQTEGNTEQVSREVVFSQRSWRERKAWGVASPDLSGRAEPQVESAARNRARGACDSPKLCELLQFASAFAHFVGS